MTLKIVKVSQSLVSRNGYLLHLPGMVANNLIGLPEPDIYSQSSVQLFPLGTKLEFSDGRLFRYGKWGATSTNVPLARMVVNANLCPGATGEPDVDGYEGDPYVAAAAGAQYVDLEIATAYAENFFEDGMLAVFPTYGFREYRICGSELGNGTYCRVYLDTPNGYGLKEALTVTTGVTAYKSMFSQLKDAAAEGATFVSAMGVVLTTTFTANYYGWVQRRGRCIITPTAYFGDSADERMAQLHTDGTIALKAAHGTHTVGYLTQRTESGYGDLEIWLQLE